MPTRLKLNKLFSRKPKRRDVHRADRLFFYSLRAIGFLLFALILGIGVQLAILAAPALHQFGFGFLFSTQWDPVNDHFGAAPFLFGTIVSSILALVISIPISLGVALFLGEIAPKKIANPLSMLVEMLAAIPSVIYGLWGIFVLAPLLRTTLEPFLGKTLGFLPLFQGAPFGVGMLTAGIILAIMITPTISAIAREVFRTIPLAQREAARALGATRWETTRLAVLGSSRLGIYGAVTLGLGRALGETMAVTMVIGNRNEISASLFAPGQTMASVIANEYSEATSDLHLSALAAIGLTLFGVSLIINIIARILVRRVRIKEGG